MDTLALLYEDIYDTTYQKRYVKCLFSKCIMNCDTVYIISLYEVAKMFPALFIGHVVSRIWAYIDAEVISSIVGNLPVQQSLDPDNFWYLSGEVDQQGNDDKYDSVDIYNEGGDHWDTMNKTYEEYCHESINSISLCVESTSMNLINNHQDPVIDTGAGLSSTPHRDNLRAGSSQPCTNLRVSGPFGPALTPECQGTYGKLGIPMIVSSLLKDTLLSFPAICDGGETNEKHVAIFTSEGSEIYTEHSIEKQMFRIRTQGDQVISGYRKKGLHHACELPLTKEISIFLMNVKGPLFYDELHRITGHSS